MDSSYPRSPDLSGVGIPQSPDLNNLQLPEHRPESPDLSSLGSPRFGSFAHYQAQAHPQSQAQRFPGAFGGNTSHYTGYQPTSVPQLSPYNQQFQPPHTMAPRRVKNESEDDDYMPDAPDTKRPRRVKQEPGMSMNGQSAAFAPSAQVKTEPSDPTLGCQLKTSFPVARIKRIMQADEDIGKVAQVTPTVVSRALELFMIKLISAAAHQARGPGGEGAAASKGPRRILAQHLKKAVLADEKLDFLEEIVSKVPDAPSKAKKEAASDSEDAKPKKKGKKRKDSVTESSAGANGSRKKHPLSNRFSMEVEADDGHGAVEPAFQLDPALAGAAVKPASASQVKKEEGVLWNKTTSSSRPSPSAATPVKSMSRSAPDSSPGGQSYTSQRTGYSDSDEED